MALSILQDCHQSQVNQVFIIIIFKKSSVRKTIIEQSPQLCIVRIPLHFQIVKRMEQLISSLYFHHPLKKTLFLQKCPSHLEKPVKRTSIRIAEGRRNCYQQRNSNPIIFSGSNRRWPQVLQQTLITWLWLYLRCSSVTLPTQNTIPKLHIL